ncbi:F-box protein At1g47340-like [Arachis duranensis]|uniref:F-box protein At1g47340-like n=1 Tax=Arachis duranensis TaxID=130453 RepID=A0A6P5MHW5_ARADU|nr:F-box protein At1g47340-like [Arachis duranensis]
MSCFASLRVDIIIDIFVRLPIKSVLICRCVCKDWNILISDPNFAKLLFTRTLPATMIRPFRSRIFRLAEYDPIEWHERRNNPCCCRVFDVLNHSSSSIKLDPKFEIPGPKPFKGRVLYIEVLSCNGLFYLSGPEYRNISLVCNPITGEFIRLPKIPQLRKHCKQIHWGFGFHPKTNQYKLVRIQMFKHDHSMVVEMHTVGTLTWINIEIDYPKNLINLYETGTYLNGALHWIGLDVDGNVSIWAFNFDTEKFQTFSMAPMDPDTKVIVFEFRDSLCLLYSNELLGTMWRMERYGVGESWTPIFQYSASSTSRLHGCIAYHDPENQEFRILLTTPWYDDHFQIVHYVPSLIRLKDIIIGDNILVQNIYS